MYCLLSFNRLTECSDNSLHNSTSCSSVEGWFLYSRNLRTFDSKEDDELIDLQTKVETDSNLPRPSDDHSSFYRSFAASCGALATFPSKASIKPKREGERTMPLSTTFISSTRALLLVWVSCNSFCIALNSIIAISLFSSSCTLRP